MLLFTIAALLLALAVCAIADDASPELVRNPSFSPGEGGGAPAGWSIWKPAWEPAACTVRSVSGGLLVRAPGRPYAVGGAEQVLEGIVAGQAYRVQASCELSSIPFPCQAATLRLSWLQGDRPLHPAGMLVRGPVVEGAAGTFDDVLVAPEGADAALLTLEVRWPQGGSVLWHSVSVRATEPPKPRTVRIGTVYLRPTDSTPEKNLELWCEQVAAAGRLGVDIVCLGEAMLSVGTSASAGEVAEPIPGPATERLGAVAREHRVWVVACLNERDGDTLYNTAVLIDREGRVVGKYRKVHLPREEWRAGVTPGSEYPVFRTDFGTIAIQICYDWFFPEVATLYALQGAEIIFAPTWGTTFPDKDGMAEGETVFRVRARDNGVYMVPAVYDGISMVIDPMGRILASNEGQTGVFWAEVDLNQREPLWWVGHWRSIGPRDRMPETYGGLTKRDRQGRF